MEMVTPVDASAGEVLRFDLVVTAGANGATLVADRCPIDRVAIGDLGGQFMLNCLDTEGGVLIAANESVVFHLELALPVDTGSGPATLTWTSTGPTGHSAGATITIQK